MAIAFRDVVINENTANSATVQAVIPPTVQAGDVLIAVWWAAGTSSTAADPAGWTPVDGPIDKGTAIRSYSWTKVATSADAGASLTVTKSVADATKKYLAVIALTGANSSSILESFSSNVESTAGTSHVSPTATAVGAGEWLVQFYADRGSPASSAITPPGDMTERAEFDGAAGGSLSIEVATKAVSAGTVGGGSYTGTVSTANVLMWSFVVKASGGSAATAAPGVLSTSVSFLAPNVLTGGAVTVTPNPLRLNASFLPMVGAATASVTPNVLQAGASLQAPTNLAHSAALTVPDPLPMSVTFLEPAITAAAPPPDETPPDVSSGRFKFRSPTRIESWPLKEGTPLAVKVEINLTMYRINGQWHSGSNLTWVDLEGADRVYYGGYDVVVPDNELAEMVAQGFDVAVQVDDSETANLFLELFTENF